VPATITLTHREKQLTDLAEIAQKNSDAIGAPACLGFYMTNPETNIEYFVLYDEVMELLKCMDTGREPS